MTSLCYIEEKKLIKEAPNFYKDIYNENLSEIAVKMLIENSCSKLKVSKKTPLEVLTAAGLLAAPKFRKFEGITGETDCINLKEFPLDIEIGN